MKAFKLTGIREMEMMEVPDPGIKNKHDVLIRMKTLGVCGSDIHYYTTGKIGMQVVQYPFTVGHEGAGEVIETGEAVTRVRPGDKIAIDPAMPCHQCDQCRVGRRHTCRNLKFLGTPGQAEGCLSEYIVMPEDSCYPIHANLDYDHAAISEPLAIGVYAVQQSIHLRGTDAGILGFGPIGMSVLLPAKAQGAKRIFVTDKIDERLAIAKKEGAYWTGNPDKEDVEKGVAGKEPLLLDVVFECCGQQDAINNAMNILKPGGKLMIIGIPETDKLWFPVDTMRHKEITITNVRRQVDCVQPSLEMMASGSIDISNMPTHRFPFKDTQKAFDLVAGYKDGVMKAMLDF